MRRESERNKHRVTCYRCGGRRRIGLLRRRICDVCEGRGWHRFVGCGRIVPVDPIPSPPPHPDSSVLRSLYAENIRLTRRCQRLEDRRNTDVNAAMQRAGRLEAELAAVRKALEPVLWWYDGDGEIAPAPTLEAMVAQVASDLRDDRAEVLRLRNTNRNLNRRAQQADKAAREAFALVQGRPWTGGTFGRALLAWRCSRLEEEQDAIVAYLRDRDGWDGSRTLSANVIGIVSTMSELLVRQCVDAGKAKEQGS